MSKKPSKIPPGGSRLDDTELQNVDVNAKPTHKPLSPEEMKKLREKVASVIEKMMNEDE
jgi:hypothetical protein